jgi:hypothetical protein
MPAPAGPGEASSRRQAGQRLVGVVKPLLVNEPLPEGRGCPGAALRSGSMAEVGAEPPGSSLQPAWPTPLSTMIRCWMIPCASARSGRPASARLVRSGAGPRAGRGRQRRSCRRLGERQWPAHCCPDAVAGAHQVEVAAGEQADYGIGVLCFVSMGCPDSGQAEVSEWHSAAPGTASAGQQSNIRQQLWGWVFAAQGPS